MRVETVCALAFLIAIPVLPEIIANACDTSNMYMYIFCCACALAGAAILPVEGSLVAFALSFISVMYRNTFLGKLALAGCTAGVMVAIECGKKSVLDRTRDSLLLHDFSERVSNALYDTKLIPVTVVACCALYTVHYCIWQIIYAVQWLTDSV